MLTENQKHQIIFMRMKGMGYRSIATDLGVSRDTVRSFCTRNNLSGYGSEFVCNGDNSNKLEYKICLYCGKELIQSTNAGRKKKYCDDVCKKEYEKEHPKLYRFKCQYCDNQFQAAGSKERKYCSNECYVRDRFWRDEDTIKIIESIKEQKKISNMPKWFKDIILECIKE